MHRLYKLKLRKVESIWQFLIDFIILLYEEEKHERIYPKSSIL